VTSEENLSEPSLSRSWTSFGRHEVRRRRSQIWPCIPLDRSPRWCSTTSKTPGPSPRHGFAFGCLPPNCATLRSPPLGRPTGHPCWIRSRTVASRRDPLRSRHLIIPVPGYRVDKYFRRDIVHSKRQPQIGLKSTFSNEVAGFHRHARLDCPLRLGPFSLPRSARSRVLNRGARYTDRPVQEQVPSSCLCDVSVLPW
jgi:hypothetical protein